MKFAADCYLEFVWRQGLPYRRLTSNFLALACRKALKEGAESDRIGAHIGLVEFILYNQENPARFQRSVSTESNLNSDVFRDILSEIGLICDPAFSLKLPLVDASLLKNRNDIVHGGASTVDDATYTQLHSMVVELLEQAATAIENAAAMKTYLRPVP